MHRPPSTEAEGIRAWQYCRYVHGSTAVCGGPHAWQYKAEPGGQQVVVVVAGYLLAAADKDVVLLLPAVQAGNVVQLLAHKATVLRVGVPLDETLVTEVPSEEHQCFAGQGRKAQQRRLPYLVRLFEVWYHQILQYKRLASGFRVTTSSTTNFG